METLAEGALEISELHDCDRGLSASEAWLAAQAQRNGDDLWCFGWLLCSPLLFLKQRLRAQCSPTAQHQPAGENQTLAKCWFHQIPIGINAFIASGASTLKAAAAPPRSAEPAPLPVLPRLGDSVRALLALWSSSASG